MAERNVYNAAVDKVEPNSLVIYGNSFDTVLTSSGLNVLNSQDQHIFGSFGPSVVQGESSNLHACHKGTNSGRICDSYTLANSQMQTERNVIGDHLYAVPDPLNHAQAYSCYMAGMPLSAASLSTILPARGIPRQHLGSFAACDSLAYNLRFPINANSIDDLNHSNSSSQTSLRCGHDSTYTDTGTKCEIGPAAKAMGRTGFESFGSMVSLDPHGWVTCQDSNFGSDCTGLPMLNQELSLRLATANRSVCTTSIQDQYSELCCSSSQYDGCLSPENTPSSRNQSWRFNSSKQAQLSQLFSNSSYVRAIQEILATVAFYSLGNVDQINYPANRTGDQANSSFSVVNFDDFPDEDCSVTVQNVPGSQVCTYEKKKKRLLALLQVVDKQYNQCLDEIHTVISAFHAVTELNPHVHARFALQTISLLYRSLRERISNHILAMGLNIGKEATRMEEKSFETSFIQKQWAIQQLRQRDNQLFRPQRGLPERSVSVLKAWMFQNFLHPYPKDAEKHLLAIKSGLSRSQVSNWFINARVRIWKPMIEEMYAEMNRRRSRNDEETNDNQRSHVTVENQRYAPPYRHY